MESIHNKHLGYDGIMNTAFEEEVAELQSNLVALDLEYANDNADEIFLYCSKEKIVCYFDAFT